MSAVLQIACNAVAAKILTDNRDIKLICSAALSYQVEGCEFTSAYRSGGWDGRSSFFHFRDGVFPAGFVHLLQTDLQRRGFVTQVIRKPLPEPFGPDSPIVDTFGNSDPRYDYQMEVVRRLLKHGVGIARVATGGGKSKIAKLAVARIKRPSLFLTTRSILMYQMRDGFVDAGFKVGVLGDGEWCPIRGVNVGMVQTLVQRLQLPSADAAPAAAAHQQRVRDATIGLLQNFELIIGEEAHEAGGNSYWEILKHCRNANYRLALTATPFMRPDAEANMRLMGAFGPILIEVTEQELIERGILATPYFKYVTLSAPALLKRHTAWPRCYKLGIVENEIRNRHIVFEAMRASKYGLPVMILVQHKAHGKALEQMLKAAGVPAEFIFGEDTQRERKSALKRLESGSLKALIGSTILDVGVDVPAVGLVVLAGGGKGEIQLRQRIGRGLRAKKKGPNVALIVDFTDDTNGYLRDHAGTRRQIVSDTPGFAERILRLGEDFDFAGLGLIAKAA